MCGLPFSKQLAAKIGNKKPYTPSAREEKCAIFKKNGQKGIKWNLARFLLFVSKQMHDSTTLLHATS